MKVGIESGEGFPIYSVHRDGFEEIEVSEEELKRWKLVFELFENMQAEIVKKMEEQGKEYWASHNTFNGYWIND